jgi:hypothetical protein
VRSLSDSDAMKSASCPRTIAGHARQKNRVATAMALMMRIVRSLSATRPRKPGIRTTPTLDTMLQIPANVGARRSNAELAGLLPRRARSLLSLSLLLVLLAGWMIER